MKKEEGRRKILKGCLKSTDPEGETGNFPSPLGTQRERAVEMMLSTWHFMTTLRLFRHVLRNAGRQEETGQQDHQPGFL